MKKLLQVSLLASAVIMGLSGCNDDKATNAPAVEKKAAATQERSASDLSSFEAKSAYAIGLSMGRYIGSTLEKQQELGVDLDNDTILEGVRDGFTDKGSMSDEEIQEALMAYDTHINELIETQAKEEADKNLAEGEKFLAENAKRDGVKVTESGLQYEVLSEGKGDKPKAEDVVTVHYVGTLIDGTEFDSSIARGEPTSFPLNQVIPGWTEGVQLMPVGAKYKFVIPSELAYGENGASTIPGNAVLVFEVELLEIEASEQDAAATNAPSEEKAAATKDDTNAESGADNAAEDAKESKESAEKAEADTAQDAAKPATE
ncbi:peptidylprolyl isomerase [Oceanisphaera avium]|uniref:Peptidyl-prolyl cis-trans isomerase n=1 Tax=Oceanisphaera avium TaxID=1903694 RepID=A0A1Y0CXB3_9GAMM|nr:peptidylprolyl isomerase [Oceanisphaera avium]